MEKQTRAKSRAQAPITYVAFLRSVNVGGNNKVEMAKLAQTFERLGFTGVRTFIASGNVIFRTVAADQASMVKKIESAIASDFGVRIKVLLRDLKGMGKLVKAIPDSWVNDEAMKCDVMFLWK